MKEKVLNFIQANSFPCIMAKAVAKKGYLETHYADDLTNPLLITKIREKLYTFIDHFRQNSHKLSSFILIVEDQKLQRFDQFENVFFQFLRVLNTQDKLLYPHDSRVSSDVSDPHFSYSIKSEAFFLVALHPESPRWSRRFEHPAIVFNPHIQFEELRKKKVYRTIRDTIRQRDKLIQGFINPMLNDFGTRSEVFQYSGKTYGENAKVPLKL